jgi:hypothetical protein
MNHKTDRKACFLNFRLEAWVTFITQKLIITMEELFKFSIACTPDIVSGVAQAVQ